MDVSLNDSNKEDIYAFRIMEKEFLKKVTVLRKKNVVTIYYLK